MASSVGSRSRAFDAGAAKAHEGAGDPRRRGRGLRERFEAVRFPVVALAVTDDEMITERGTHVLADCRAHAPRRVERIAPEDVRAWRIGHFGFFREAFEPTLWRRALEVLRELATAAARPAITRETA